VTLDQKLKFTQHLKNARTEIIIRSKHFRSLTYKNKGISTKTATNIFQFWTTDTYSEQTLLTKLKKTQTTEQIALRLITKIRLILTKNPANPLHNPSNQLLYEHDQNN